MYNTLQEKLAAYIAACVRRQKAMPSERPGQVYFNVLFYTGFDVEFANEIRGTDLDPFYFDGGIRDFMDALIVRWAKEYGWNV